MGVLFREIVSGSGVAHELSILNGAAAAAATGASPVIARAPLNETHKSQMEPNGEEIEIEQYVSLFVLSWSAR